jgi:predicted nucleotidyltransferase
MTAVMETPMFGLDDNDMKMIRDVLSSYPEIESVILYGSRATGRFKRGSDVDIMLRGKNLSHETLLDIKNDFYESNLPYFFDIVIESNINDKLKQEIEKTGRLLYTF